jgi:hypothetical protein
MIDNHYLRSAGCQPAFLSSPATTPPFTYQARLRSTKTSAMPDRSRGAKAITADNQSRKAPPQIKKGSRERDPYALSPSIRFRRGGIGPPREEETADYYNARPMPQQRRIPIRIGSDESNGFTPIQSSTIASAGNRPLRFLTILTMRLHSLEYSSRGGSGF